MTLKQQLYEDMKQAMRDRDKDKLETIRYAIAQVKNAEIDHGELDDPAVLAILNKVTKQIKEALTDFTQAQRQDLVASEEAKLKIMQAYLPAQMSDQELGQIVDRVIAEHGPNVGAIMGQVMKQVKGQVDGGRVSNMVQSRLKSSS
ncbi:MAG: GatB/YqeY domain-containing protein [Patescibacteria group bacterium]|nr:GatB/YqeY domain-containing protein [Patescibacteria group bacterium]